MKIQSILPYKRNNFSNIYLYISPSASKLTKNTYQCDKVSFTGTALSYEEFRPIRMQAYETQLEAVELQGKSKKVVKDAYEALSTAKSEYIKALNIIKIFKQDPQREVRKLKNGNELRFKSELKDDTWHLEATEHDFDGNTIRSFKAVNFNPVSLTTYNDDFNYYQFSDKDVTIMQRMNATSLKAGGAEAVYKYTLGKLVSASIDLQALEKPQIVTHMYFYDDNGNLRIYTNSNETNDSCTSCDERYVFDDNNKLLTYLSGFSSDTSSNAMKFDKSMHFDDGKFIAYTNGAKSVEKDCEIVSKDAYYLKDGKFVYTTDFHFLMTDLEPIIFEDME